MDKSHLLLLEMWLADRLDVGKERVRSGPRALIGSSWRRGTNKADGGTRIRIGSPESNSLFSPGSNSLSLQPQIDSRQVDEKRRAFGPHVDRPRLRSWQSLQAPWRHSEWHKNFSKGRARLRFHSHGSIEVKWVFVCFVLVWFVCVFSTHVIDLPCQVKQNQGVMLDFLRVTGPFQAKLC